MSEKVAISLDAELLERAEKLRRTTGESRSALIARALRELLETEAHSRRVADYIEAYRRLPETDEDVEAARELSRRSVRTLPWDDG